MSSVKTGFLLNPWSDKGKFPLLIEHVTLYIQGLSRPSQCYKVFGQKISPKNIIARSAKRVIVNSNKNIKVNFKFIFISIEKLFLEIFKYFFKENQLETIKLYKNGAIMILYLLFSYNVINKVVNLIFGNLSSSCICKIQT